MNSLVCELGQRSVGIEGGLIVVIFGVLIF